MKKLDISVVIPTLNRRESLCNTLNFMLTCEYIPNEIVIVDQSDKEYIEKTRKVVQEKFAQYNIKYLELDIQSSTVARNVGIRNALNDILVFMDDDVEVYQDTFLNVNRIMEDDDITMIGALDDNTSGRESIFGYLFAIKSWKRRKVGHVTPAVMGNYPRSVSGQVSTEWAQGYFFVVRKSLLEKWDILFDERLQGYAYAEDLDFSYSYYLQSKKEGKRCVLDSLVRVKHHCTREWRVSSKKFTYAFVFNRKYLRNKYFPNFYGRFCFYYSNLGHLCWKVMHRDNVKDYLMSILYCLKFRRDILSGDFHYKLYEK